MLTAVVSDLHLGARMSVLATPPARERLIGELARADRIVLLGDLLSLRAAPVADVLKAAAPFLEGLREAAAGTEVVVVPGNHDHRLAEPVLDGRAGALGLEQAAAPGATGLAGELARRLEGVELTIAYPGLWIRPDVYATHGHYLDCHMTVPRPECLLAAVVSAAMGRLPERGARPDDYEAVLAPIYAYGYGRAQVADSGAERSRAANMVRRVRRLGWERMNGRRRWTAPGELVRDGVAAAGALGALGALNLAGLGPFRADISPGAIGRAGRVAVEEVVARLAIEADHVIFGHTHRAGPLPGEEGWRLPSGTALVNGGSWVYEAGLIGPDGPDDPFWPGRCVLVEDEGPPRLRSLLEEPTATVALA